MKESDRIVESKNVMDRESEFIFIYTQMKMLLSLYVSTTEEASQLNEYSYTQTQVKN